MHESLKRYLDTKNNNLSPHQQFVLDIQENYEAATFNQATEQGHKKFKFTRIPKEESKTGIKYMADVLQQIDQHETIHEFVKTFFNKEGERFQRDFPEANIKNAIDIVSNIDKQTAERFAQGVLVHAFGVTKQNTLENLTRLLEMLQNKGINIDESPGNNINALHWASAFGYIDKVKILLEHNASTEVKDSEGRTASSWALEQGHNNIFHLILDHEINPKSNKITINESPDNTLYHTTAHGNTDKVKLPTNFKDRVNVHDTVTHKPYRTEAPLNNYSNIESKDSKDKTNLHLATIKGDIARVKELLDNNANIKATDIKGNQPLGYALEKGHMKIFHLLFDEMVKLQEVDVAKKPQNTKIMKLTKGLPLKPEEATNTKNISHSEKILQRRTSLENNPKQNIKRSNSFNK